MDGVRISDYIGILEICNFRVSLGLGLDWVVHYFLDLQKLYVIAITRTGCHLVIVLRHITVYHRVRRLRVIIRSLVTTHIAHNFSSYFNYQVAAHYSTKQ